MGSTEERVSDRSASSRNASAKGCVWFWPKIAAALTSKHHWLVINCDSCGTVVDLDLRVKSRDPELRFAMCDARVAMAMAARAFSRWRSILRSKRGWAISSEQGGTMKSPIIKRAIMIDGRKTSISLEDAFWSSLKEIAHAERATVSELVAKIDKTRKQGNLSSAVRLFVLDRVRNGQTGKQQ